MSEVPGTEWTADHAPSPADAPFAAAWTEAGTVIHVFTHFRLELAIYRAAVPAGAKAPPGAWWADAAMLPGEALPSVMKKAIEAALPGATKQSDQRRSTANVGQVA